MNNTTICIIDDHEIVRQGLKDLLEKLGDFDVVLEFEDGQVFLDALPLPTQPDIFILDYSMPHLTGIEVLQRLENREEEYKVLLLTQHFDETIINKAYGSGARGFLNKNCSAQELKYSLENIMNSGYSNLPGILKRMKSDEYKQTHIIKMELSTRELQFITLVCSENEYTYDRMGEIMGVSTKTIDACRASLFDRFKIKSKVGLVLFSFNNRLTEPFL